MSELIVITFDNPDEAQQVATTFKDLEKGGGIRLADMRVVVKDGEGKLVAKDEAGHPVAWSALAGGVLGGVLFFMVPVVGIAIGAAAGAAITKSLDLDIDKKFVQEVAATLKPNTSAIFLLARQENQAAVLNALKPYKGTLIQTTLSTDMEEQLKKTLST